MWSFGSKAKHVQQVAARLDAAFSEALSTIAHSGVDTFRNGMASNSAIMVVNDGPAAHNTVSWRDQRVPDFLFWLDLNAGPWSLHATGRSSQFFGIMLSAGPASSNDAVSKVIAVQDQARGKATLGAKQVGKLLAKQHNYRDISKFMAVRG